MKIGLDIRMIDNTGIGTTIRALLDHLSPQQLSQLVLLGPTSTSKRYPCDWKQTKDPIYSFSQHVRYGRFLNKQGFTLYHMPHFDVPCGYKGRLIVTVFDLIHVLYPQFSTKPFSRVYALWRLRHVAKHANQIIVPSQNTKKDLLHFFPDIGQKISVIDLAVDESFKPASKETIDNVMSKYNLRSGYIFYLGNIRRSKNSARLVEAYKQFREKRKDVPPLVMSGNLSYSSQKSLGIEEGIQYLGKVPSEDINALYSAALFFMFPSIYEGFGLPPLEAMACGTPTIVSKVASLPEVCGEASYFVDPFSISDMVRGMETLMDSSTIREQLRENGFKNVRRFSWSRFSQETWRIYEKVGLA